MCLLMSQCKPNFLLQCPASHNGQLTREANEGSDVVHEEWK